MAKGISESDVHCAADALVAAGERPTVERIRAHLGTGSPNTVIRWLDTWWGTLGGRLVGNSALPDLPEDVASAFAQVWQYAVASGRAATEREVASERAALATLTQKLIDQAAQQGDEVTQAQAAMADARIAAEQGAQRLLDLQQLLEQQAQQLTELREQRSSLQERGGRLEGELTLLRQELTAQQMNARGEREEWGAHIRALEDRAAREIDRARQELKIVKAEGLVAGKTAHRREQALQQSLQKAERTIAEQAGRLKAQTSSAQRRDIRTPKGSPTTGRRLPARPK
ncbi:DNA-binding protein [Lysobacter auxotrophicus]|uniref:DNA-binding protein n=1 Tax=Lysobacter auxotrophicus TaxID=2992573 RepID=A0ABM8DDK5_9GAMM|nr:DNA-binding protein [Lysobacter auxotrophicus]BDU16680.1 DNA-binding protein [Lysobacter auxotrophicus]